MKQFRFTEDQIIGILKDHGEAWQIGPTAMPNGGFVADLCRKHGVSDATVYKRKAKFAGMDVSEAKRLKAVKDENAKLKRLLADTMLDNVALKNLLAKKMVTPAAEREAVAHLIAGDGMGERRACRDLGLCRIMARYRTVRVDDEVLRKGMMALAHKRLRFGYSRLNVLLRREGHAFIHKRLFRMYGEDEGRSENSPGGCFPDGTACAAPGWPETGHRQAGADVGADGAKSAVVAGFSVGSTDGWAAVPDGDRGRQLHPRLTLRSMTSSAPATVAQPAHLGRTEPRSLAQVGQNFGATSKARLRHVFVEARLGVK